MKGTLVQRHYSFMKVLVLALSLGCAAPGQIADPPSTIPAGMLRFRDTAAPLESWLGKRLVIFDQAPQSFSGSPWMIICPGTGDPSEAIITTDVIFVSLAQLRGFASASALADFLSHAAAHAKVRPFSGFSIRILSPHIPDKYVQQIDGNRCRIFESVVAPVAAEFRDSSNCTPESCAAFERLLAAAKQ